MECAPGSAPCRLPLGHTLQMLPTAPQTNHGLGACALALHTQGLVRG